MSNTLSRRTDLPLKVGITGGIGSGKTTVSNIFRMLGIAVFEADKTARELYNKDENIRNQLIDLFGKEIYNPGDLLNRRLLASIIFNDRKALLAVNNIVHPAVREEFDEWVTQQKGVYVLHEAAILFESGFYRIMDINILITAPDELRIHRVMKRDQMEREEVIKRMQNQFAEEESVKLADFIILNDEKDFIIRQVLETDKKIREHGKIR